MDIHPAYFMLQGKPWIYYVEAISSTLHQKLNYVINGSLVTVKVEGSLMISKNMTILYIELVELAETSFPSLEIVHAKLVPKNVAIPKHLTLLK